jgi:hypothetical protein
MVIAAYSSRRCAAWCWLTYGGCDVYLGDKYIMFEVARAAIAYRAEGFLGALYAGQNGVGVTGIP